MMIVFTLQSTRVLSKDDFECGVSNEQVYEYLVSKNYQVSSITLYKECDRIAITSTCRVLVFIEDGNIINHEEIDY
jgi:hypothetical protein